MRVLICDDMFPAMIDIVTAQLPNDEVRVCPQRELGQHAPWAEVLIPTMACITAETINSAPDLKLIQQSGVGLEGVDLAAAAAKGVPVANVPGNEAPIHAESTAEGGVFLMMACARLFKQTQAALAAGLWGRPSGQALIERRALIIGLGAVGRALAQKLVALGMTVNGVDALLNAGLADALGMQGVYGPQELFRLLPETDFLISAVTLTPETRGLLGREVFSRMKPSAYVINISRGPIVNEEELLAAIDQGLIAGAGLDVLNTEPPDPASPLLRHPKVVITPHTAGGTIQSFEAVGRGVADNIERLRAGRPLRNLAQPV